MLLFFLNVEERLPIVLHDLLDYFLNWWNKYGDF